MTLRAERARERGPKAAAAALWRLKHEAHDRLAAVAAPFNAVLRTWDARLAAGQIHADYHRHATAELRQQRAEAVATARTALDAELADIERHHDQLAAQRAPTTADEFALVQNVARALESTVLDADLKFDLLRDAVTHAADADQVNLLRELRPYLEGLSRLPAFADPTSEGGDRFTRAQALLATVAAETETEFTIGARLIHERAGGISYELGELAAVIGTHGSFAAADDPSARVVDNEGKSMFRELTVPGFEPPAPSNPTQSLAGMMQLLGKDAAGWRRDAVPLASDAELRAAAEAT